MMREFDIMRQEIVNVYKFSELSAEAQGVAIEKYRESIDWSYESEDITSNFNYRLDELGLPTDDVEWSLNHCQGDGVAFYGFVDMPRVARRLLEGESLKLYELIKAEDLTISAKLYRNSFGHHYSHYNTMEIEMIADDNETIVTYLYESNSEELTTEEWDEKVERIQLLVDELAKLILEDAKNTSIQLERAGYEQIDYVNSDEYIKEAIESNDYEFTADGTIY